MAKREANTRDETKKEGAVRNLIGRDVAENQKAGKGLKKPVAALHGVFVEQRASTLLFHALKLRLATEEHSNRVNNGDKPHESK